MLPDDEIRLAVAVEEFQMRSLFAGLAMLTFASAASAADLDDVPLRGSQPYLPGYPGYFNWSGVFFGAQAGWSLGHSEATQAGTLASLSDSHGGVSYGVFAGYNFQWENVILGAEINYSHTDLPTSFAPAVSTVGTLGARVSDLATLRGRAGWVFGNVLPYGFAGLAVARTDLTRTFGTSGVYSYGWALGAGLDWAVLPNLFLRAEYEYVGLGRVEDVQMHVSTVRGAVAWKY